MIQASPPASLWYPGKKLEGFGAAQLSASAREIAKNREELLGLLQDLPESEYELSLTDLIEKPASTVDDAPVSNADGNSPGEREAKRATTVVKEREKMRRNSSSGFGSSGSGSGSGSGGVLLNMYMPSSLSRSLTASRASRGAVSPKVAVGCAKREKEPVMFGCLSGLWERRREKSKKVEERKRRSETKTAV